MFTTEKQKKATAELSPKKGLKEKKIAVQIMAVLSCSFMRAWRFRKHFSFARNFAGQG